MAVSISGVVIPLSRIRVQADFPSYKKSPAPLSLACNKSLSIAAEPATRKSTICKVLSESDSTLSSMVTELERERVRVSGDEEQEADKAHSKESHDAGLPYVWRDIHGENDWVGLLDPMDPLLRSELIRYGEMAQACYDAFDYDPFSKYCGSCRFTRGKFFKSLGMNQLGYDVTRYLYATPNINLPNFFKKSRWPRMWSNDANWAGYVAISDDRATKRLGRRDITIAWRGTVSRLEWIVDLMDFLKPISSNNIPCPDQTVKVESGFVDLYTSKDDACRFCRYSAREQILAEVRRLLEMYEDEELSITITGHSLGSALAVLSAYDIVETGLHVKKDSRAVPVSVFSFSGPRVVNVRFKERLECLGVKVLRVFNAHDIVPKSPGFLFNEQVPSMLMKLAEPLPWSYSHVGVEFQLDHHSSPFLKPTNDPVCAHNLEALLHLIDGYHGRGERFVLASGRDPALVNKACDFLKDHYLVPPNWRQDENKGMIKNRDGRWEQPERPKLDDHPHDIHHHLCQLGLASSDF
ncbi:phospholipase A1-Igamma1, chloroplastic-like [Prosopis cineraria]|uniref:phospholipase A1-Igamma1, chloroplastic-like n=1 Tax=Prosopis cineraria TaxID=364024 RepID=UPI00240EC9C4|nr:phospholipase A1-Igamma1, chloroplastic-like [Prosopis cineraria]